MTTIRYMLRVAALASVAALVMVAYGLAQTVIDVTAPPAYYQIWNTLGYPLTPGAPGTIYDLTGETFHLRNSSNPNTEGVCNYAGADKLPVNPYPIQNAGDGTQTPPLHFGTQDAQFRGGRVIGEVSMAGDGSVMGYCNSAAMDLKSNISTAQHVSRIRIDRVWDGIRFNQFPCQNTAALCNQGVDHVWISNTRDDAIECDFFGCQTVRDSLFDGVFSFLSITPTSCSGCADHTAENVYIERNLVRLAGRPYTSAGLGGYVPDYHVAFLKVTPAIAPNIIINDSVIAAEFYMPLNQTHWANTWASISSCSNNVFLWMKDTAIPPQLVPQGVAAGCFTVLTGAEARAYWTGARAQWLRDNLDVERLAGE